MPISFISLMHSHMMGISAIIATVNRKEELRRLFESFIANDSNCFELIVVDQNVNGLIDDLILEYENYLPITHLKLTVANQSKARNFGVIHAKYPIVCFPDDDCWYDDDTLKDVMKQYEVNKSIDLLIINWKQSPKKGIKPVNVTRKEIYSYKAPISYNTYVLFFLKETLVRIGLFNETIGLGLYIGAGEDVEIIFRTAKHSLNILINPNIYVNHKYTPDYKRSLTDTRCRQRAPGFIYSKYRLPLNVVFRGLMSPLVKTIVCMNVKEMKVNYYTFLARVEGVLYGMKN